MTGRGPVTCGTAVAAIAETGDSTPRVAAGDVTASVGTGDATHSATSTMNRPTVPLPNLLTRWRNLRSMGCAPYRMSAIAGRTG